MSEGARFQQHRDASFHQVFYFPTRQGVEGNSRHFLPGGANDLSAPLYRWHLKLKDFTKVVSVSYSPYHKAVSQLVEALSYKPESRGSNPDSVIEIFH